MLQRPPLALPLWQSVIKNKRVVMSRCTQHPPSARCRIDSGAVIHNDGVSVAKSELSHPARELRRRSEHVRQRVVVVGEIVNIEKHGTGYVRGIVFKSRISLRLRQGPGSVR